MLKFIRLLILFLLTIVLVNITYATKSLCDLQYSGTIMISSFATTFDENMTIFAMPVITNCSKQPNSRWCNIYFFHKAMGNDTFQSFLEAFKVGVMPPHVKQSLVNPQCKNCSCAGTKYSGCSVTFDKYGTIGEIVIRCKNPKKK